MQTWFGYHQNRDYPWFHNMHANKESKVMKIKRVGKERRQTE